MLVAYELANSNFGYWYFFYVLHYSMYKMTYYSLCILTVVAGLSLAMIIGIAAGGAGFILVIVLIILLLVCVYMCARSSKSGGVDLPYNVSGGK